MGSINWVDKCWVTTVFLVRDDGKVLLTMNKNLKTWIPVGGHVDPGENPEDAVKREVQEETGFAFEFVPKPHDGEDGRVRKIFPHHIQIEQVPHHNQHINVVFFGKCTKWDDTVATDEDEKLRWFSERELHEMKNELFETVYAGSLEAIRAVRNS